MFPPPADNGNRVGYIEETGCPLGDIPGCCVRYRHDIAPAPKRSQTTTWKEFIRRHMDVLAGTDFFTVEVLTWRGLVTYYVLFFLHLQTRRVTLAGITRHPTEEWMTQMARNAIDEESGCLRQHRSTTAIRSSALNSGRPWPHEV
jgi:putative transposase